MIQKHGLGKGLSALIPSPRWQKQDTSSLLEMSPQNAGHLAVSDGMRVAHLDLDMISANPYQPRSHFEEQSLRELVESIRMHGMITPLVVTQKLDNSYELIAGERRLRAARLCGLKEVPAIVRSADEQQKLEFALIENIQREDLNPIERAKGYKRLLNEFSLTQEQLGKRLSKPRSTIANTVRLLDLPSEIQASLEKGEISEGHARAIAGVENRERQMELWKKVTLHALPVRVVEREARKARIKSHLRAIPLHKEVLTVYENKLEEKIGTKATIKGTLEKGTIIIDYFSKEELERIVNQV